MRFRHGAYLALVLATPLLTRAADPPIPPPVVVQVKIDTVSPVTAEVGKKCVVEVKTTAKKVTWRIPEGVDSIALDGKRLAIWALPGTYTLTALVPNGDDVALADVTVTITGGVPGPAPNAFLAELKAAYAKDTGTNKAVLLGKLASLYRAAGTVTVKDPSVKTYFDLFSDVSTANAAQMGQTDLQNIRTVIAKRLDATLPTDKKTPIDRTVAAAEFIAVATALEGLK